MSKCAGFPELPVRYAGSLYVRPRPSPDFTMRL